MPNPVVIAFPFLPLAEPITFGGWWLGPACGFDGPWADAALKRMGTRFLKSFRDAHGKPVRNPALLASADGCVSGARPGDVERAALRKVVAFATIDRNPPYGKTHVSGHYFTTADNADYWEQPIDLQKGFITLERGGRVRHRTGRYRLANPEFRISATPETVLPLSPVRLDEVVVSALYEILVGLPEGESAEQASRLSRAISWLEKSWLNSMSIGWEDRLVFLKTGFEALTGQSKTPEAMKALVGIFESAGRQFGSGIGLESLLWQADEGTRTRMFNGTTYEVTEIEHWYGALADARNSIVHGATVPNLDYDEPGSPYCGHLVDVGDHVLREAIKVEIGNLRCPDAWRDPIGRASVAALRHSGGPSGVPRQRVRNDRFHRLEATAGASPERLTHGGARPITDDLSCEAAHVAWSALVRQGAPEGLRGSPGASAGPDCRTGSPSRSGVPRGGPRSPQHRANFAARTACRVVLNRYPRPAGAMADSLG